MSIFRWSFRGMSAGLLPCRCAARREVRRAWYSVPAMDRAQRVVVQGAPRGEDNPWTYREVKPGVGLLAMPTWALYNSKFAWESYLTALIGELNASGTRDLIIDLRANEGGLSVGDQLLATFHRAATAGGAGAAQDPLSHGAGSAAAVPGDLGQVFL